MKTDEFEVDVDTQSFRRDDDGRIVVPPPPPTSTDAVGPITSVEDLDDDLLYLRIGTSDEPVVQTVLQEYWKELASVAIGMLIILGLVLVFISRNREDDGAGSRIESIGELQSLTAPANQQAEDEPDLVGAPVRENQSSGTFVTEDDPPSPTAETSVVTSQGTQGTSVTTTPPVTSAPPTLPSTTTTIATTTTTVPPTTNIDPDDVRLANGGFDDTSVQPGTYQIVNNIPGWQSQSGEFEIWHKEYQDNIDSKDGDYFLELNANGQGLIYQDVETLPNSRIQWSLQHRGRNGRESVEILLGPPNGPYQSVDTLTSGTRRWREYDGTYVVPEGQTVTRFIIRSLVPGGSGNFLDEIRIETVDEVAD